MKKTILVLAIFYSIATPLWALDYEAIVLDNKDVKIELSNIKTRMIDVDLSNFDGLAIPVTYISKIRRVKDGKDFVLRSVTGREVKVASSSALEGEWELGKYSVSLSDVKFIEFNWTARQQGISPRDRTNSFCATITDWTGKTMDVFDLKYVGRYWWKSPYIDVSSYIKSEHRQYIPIEHKGLIMGVPFADIDNISFTNQQPTDEDWEPGVDIKLLDGTTLAWISTENNSPKSLPASGPLGK